MHLGDDLALQAREFLVLPRPGIFLEVADLLRVIAVAFAQLLLGPGALVGAHGGRVLLVLLLLGLERGLLRRQLALLGRELVAQRFLDSLGLRRILQQTRGIDHADLDLGLRRPRSQCAHQQPGHGHHPQTIHCFAPED